MHQHRQNRSIDELRIEKEQLKNTNRGQKKVYYESLISKVAKKAGTDKDDTPVYSTPLNLERDGGSLSPYRTLQSTNSGHNVQSDPTVNQWNYHPLYKQNQTMPPSMPQMPPSMSQMPPGYPQNVSSHIS